MCVGCSYGCPRNGGAQTEETPDAQEWNGGPGKEDIRVKLLRPVRNRAWPQLKLPSLSFWGADRVYVWFPLIHRQMPYDGNPRVGERFEE